MRYRILLPVCTVVALAMVPALAAGMEISAKRITATGDTGRFEAKGNVRISDGSVVLAGERLLADLGSGRAVLMMGRAQTREGVLRAKRFEFAFTALRITRIVAAGNPSLRTRQGVVFAEGMEIQLPDGRLLAWGDVRVFTPPDVTAFGSRLTYDRRSARITMQGPVRVQSVQGTVWGDFLEGSEALQEITIRGNMRFARRDITGRAQAARILGQEKRVVLEGEVFLQRARQFLWADRVIVYYQDGRVVAEGLRRLVVEE